MLLTIRDFLDADEDQKAKGKAINSNKNTIIPRKIIGLPIL